MADPVNAKNQLGDLIAELEKDAAELRWLEKDANPLAADPLIVHRKLVERIVGKLKDIHGQM
jgi:hypothetical protein